MLHICSVLPSLMGVALTGVQHREQRAGPSAQLSIPATLGELFSDMPTAAGWAMVVCEW